MQDGGMFNLAAVHADITTLHVDAIVNAANQAMRGGGGVDGAIHRAGGSEILQECIRKFPDGLATGDAGWTTAGHLPARWVIHTVGPNWHRGQRDHGLLASCFSRSLHVAHEVGAASVAFPAISAGVFGWEPATVADVAVRTVRQTGAEVPGVSLVRFVLFDAAMLGVFRQALDR